MTAAQRTLRGFYFITDPALTQAGMLDDVRQALRAGVAIVQYRDKTPSGMSRELAGEMLRACRTAGVPFVINDDVDLALAVGADGAHVGQSDLAAAQARARLGPDACLGVSVASSGELSAAEAAGASYVAASPVFGTPTKPDAGPPLGWEGVRRLRAATSLPLAVIGGIHLGNLAEMVRAGADLVCAISASLAGGDVESNVRRLGREIAAASAGATGAEHRHAR